MEEYIQKNVQASLTTMQGYLLKCLSPMYICQLDNRSLYSYVTSGTLPKRHGNSSRCEGESCLQI